MRYEWYADVFWLTCFLTDLIAFLTAAFVDGQRVKPGRGVAVAALSAFMETILFVVMNRYIRYRMVMAFGIDPSYHVLDDITQWKKYIEFPDLDSMDWENAAKRDLAHVDRKEKIVACFGMEGNFNRLQSLMGTCEALIALLEEPEAVYEFFEAYTRFKMKTIEKIARYYQPDIYVNGDDVCSGSGLFFSKSIYDQLIDLFETVPGAVSADRQGCSCADSVPLRKQEDCVHF